MAINNYERVGRGLGILAKGLRPFVDHHMGAKVPNGDWAALMAARDQQRHGSAKKVDPDDPAVLLRVLTEEWRAFEGKLSRPQQALASELRETRNAWAHDGKRTTSTDDAYRALDTMERLLKAIGSPDEADDVRRLRVDMQRSAYETQARKTSHSMVEAANVEGKGLKPWREVITPHADVISGNFSASEFAADLHMVAQGEGSEEYVDPVEFFRRTYLTTGLRDLMTRALKRIGGDTNASPIVNLQTNFGGGKTHSMLALYHLFSGVAVADLPQEVQELVEQSSSNVVGKPINRAVLVGNHLRPARTNEKPDGTTINTMWGELAYALGGKDGYAIVAEADQKRVSPGADLHTLLKTYSPCLILIDEWVSYARMLYNDDTLPAGTFDTQFTFAQTLTEAVKAVPGAMVAVSIPASHRPEDGMSGGSGLEVGGEHGQKALEKLQNVVRRVADQWRPASSEESFEIVRRRLFDEPNADARNDIAAVARTYGDFYRRHRGEFPSEALEPAYEARMRAAYPIHPELFDRLYEDWSTLDRFQRTRGVLRLLSGVIHELWVGGDTSPVILPGSIPLDRPRVFDELTQYLEDAWKPIIDTDVDGVGSTPVQVDKDRPILGARFLSRRTARAIFVASAPTLKGTHPGVELQRVRLGTAIPGDTVGNFGSALQLLTDRSTYLYVDQSRYWYDTHPNITRTARDYAEGLVVEDVWADIERRLREREASAKGLFAAVHAAPESSAEIRDTDDARLVLVGPRHPHEKADSSPALTFAEQCLRTKGSGNRVNRNMLVFLAPNKRDLANVEQAVRDFLAWQNIYQRADSDLNLTATQKSQAKSRMETADQTVAARTADAWSVLIKPDQPVPSEPARLTSSRCVGAERLAERAGAVLRREDALIVELGPNIIRHAVMTKAPAIWDGGHVMLGQIWKLCCEYPYMPRLQNFDVLETAVRAARDLITWEREGFAIASGHDEVTGRYEGLAIPHQDDFVGVSDSTLLVMPEPALAQRETEQPTDSDPSTSTGLGTPVDVVTGGKPEVEIVSNAEFHGVRRLDPEMYGRDWSKIASEVIAHLASVDGVDLEITVDIRAHAPGGVPDSKARTVSENAKVLRFEVSRFDDRTTE